MSGPFKLANDDEASAVLNKVFVLGDVSFMSLRQSARVGCFDLEKRELNCA